MENSVFAGSDYMVKPQARIRPTVPVLDPSISLQMTKNPQEEAPRRSVDSYASSVSATAVAGEMFQPDFLIVRVDKQGKIGEPHGDKLVACIEVKKDDCTPEIALRQLERYVMTLAPKALYKDFRGILVLGPTTYEYKFNDEEESSSSKEGLINCEDLEMVFASVANDVEQEDQGQQGGNMDWEI